jgi:hypothetical protein
MKYVILIMDGPESGSMTEEQQKAWYSDIYAWYEKWGGTPQLPDTGQQLQPPATARTIRASGVTDGPFIETKEAIGGYSVLETGTIEEAVEIARTWPGVAEGWTTIEVRPTVAM